MNETVLHLQICYEIAMSIGTSMEMSQMLQDCLGTYLRKLNCLAGVIFDSRKAISTEQEPIFSIPRMRALVSSENYKKALATAPWTENVILDGSANERSQYHWFELPDFGWLLLLKAGSALDPIFRQVLAPINKKIVDAILSCLQNKEIQQMILEIQQKNEQLAGSEEELKQNLEELKVTQELVNLKNILLEKNNHAIKSSITYAQRIQKAILGTPKNIERKFENCFVLFLPRDVVSGDFYWYLEKENKQIIVAADCTGHGVPGALMTMLGSIFLDEIVDSQGIIEPNEILTVLDQKISRVTQRQSNHSVNDGMDMSLLVIEQTKFSFSGAKNPLCWIHQGEIQKIQGSKCSIGGLKPQKEKIFENHVFQAEKGDMLYIFSDGFQDQASEKNLTKYMNHRFRNFLYYISPLEVLQQKQELQQELNIWKKSQAQTDDILVIGIRI